MFCPACIYGFIQSNFGKSPTLSMLDGVIHFECVTDYQTYGIDIVSRDYASENEKDEILVYKMKTIDLCDSNNVNLKSRTYDDECFELAELIRSKYEKF